MATSECVDCNLREFLVHWMLNNGLFWGFLVIIFYWFFKTMPSDQANESEEERKDMARKLKASLKSRKEATVSFAMHLALLVMQLVEGYWLLAYWWQSIYAFWTWKLKKSEWMLQFDQFVMLVLLGLALPVLLVFGFLLLVLTIECMVASWKWEPKGDEDNWQLVQGEDKGKEKQ